MAERQEEMEATVRRLTDAFNRADFEGAIEIAHPDVVFSRSWEKEPMRGTEALLAWMRPDAFEDQQLELRDLTVAGDKVLVHQHLKARGATSGIDVDVDSWAVWTLDSDGLGTRSKPRDSRPRRRRRGHGTPRLRD